MANCFQVYPWFWHEIIDNTIENYVAASSLSFETFEMSHSSPPVKRQLMRPTPKGLLWTHVR